MITKEAIEAEIQKTLSAKVGFPESTEELIDRIANDLTIWLQSQQASEVERLREENERLKDDNSKMAKILDRPDVKLNVPGRVWMQIQSLITKIESNGK